MLHTHCGFNTIPPCPQISIVNTVDCRVKEPEKDSGLMGEITGGVLMGGGEEDEEED